MQSASDRASKRARHWRQSCLGGLEPCSPARLVATWWVVASGGRVDGECEIGWATAGDLDHGSLFTSGYPERLAETWGISSCCGRLRRLVTLSRLPQPLHIRRDNNTFIHQVLPLPRQTQCKGFILDLYAGFEIACLPALCEIGRRDEREPMVHDDALGV